jgi:phage terminase large subunit
MVRYAESHKDDWMITKATWRDNPSVSKEFIDGVKKEAQEKGDISAFMQEYELEFRSVEGAVFPEFNRDIHVISPSDVPTEGTVYAAIDFGWAEDHPTAVVFVIIDAKQDWYVFDEILVSKQKLEDTIEQIKQKLGSHRLAGIVGDSARPDLIDYMASKGMPIIPADKGAGSVPAGIQLVGQMLIPREQLIGKPRPKLYFSSTCQKGIPQMEGYRYNSKKLDRKTSELPVKDKDDIPDALRYLVTHLKHGVNKKTSFPKPSVTYNSYGLL